MCAANDFSRLIAAQVEYVVVSDGPYKLQIISTSVAPKICSTNALFRGSPAKFTTRTVAGTLSSSIRAVIAEGTVLISVTSTG